MAKLNKAKNKIARREAVDLSLKTFGTKAHASLLRRISIEPGAKSTRGRRRKISDFAKQLREKQKLKRIYGLSESTMKRYFEKAIKTKGNTADALVKLLENRLDNVVYRLNFAPTRAAARQLVAHGHIAVNGKKVDISSYQVEASEKISFYKKDTPEISYIKAVIEDKNYEPPVWLKRKGLQAEITGAVEFENYQEPVSLPLVIEFYSKL
jgi:small subunit ribosomal protein S4